jgi:quinolinate synthase
VNKAIPSAFEDVRPPQKTGGKQNIPPLYYQLSQEEIQSRGAEAKRILGDDLLILCHHYQQDGTFWFADVTGDSLYLAQQAAKSTAKYIIFCGVHFMAESADIITGENQTVMLPDLEAGCSMADMADTDTVEKAWDYLVGICGANTIIPVTYINSTASLKAFCARQGGTVCTSSNADKILKWALAQNKRVLFFPDQHLGRNTANALQVGKDQICLWQRDLTDGGLSDQEILNSKVLLWDGYCSVHCLFTTAQIDAARNRIPGIKVIVHPECPEEIVQAADYSGSTNKIIDVINESAPGSSWAVGTELSLVNRLARQMAAEQQKHIECLNPTSCICSTMYQVYPGDVLWVLENLVDGKPVNQVSIAEDIKLEARQALEKMLELSSQG